MVYFNKNISYLLNKQKAIIEKSKKFGHFIVVNDYDIFQLSLTEQELNCNRSNKPIPSPRNTV